MRTPRASPCLILARAGILQIPKPLLSDPELHALDGEPTFTKSLSYESVRGAQNNPCGQCAMTEQRMESEAWEGEPKSLSLIP